MKIRYCWTDMREPTLEEIQLAYVWFAADPSQYVNPSYGGFYATIISLMLAGF